MFEIQIIENDFIDIQTDYNFKGLCVWHRSYLTGVEKWLTILVGFEVEIFTVIQKEHLKLKRKPNGYRMGDKIIGNKEFVEVIAREITLKEV